MEWISIEDEMPPEGQWVLVWNKNSQLVIVAKWQRGHWKAGGASTKKEATSHWAKIIGPKGERCKRPDSIFDFTSRDSQNT